MQDRNFIRLLTFALFFLAHWFFGNLYEEIVLAPNQLINSFEALERWQGYFTVTNQIYYYVPFTQAAVLVVCYLYTRARDKTEKALLKKSSVFGLLAVVVTVLIVTQLNVKLFFGDIGQYQKQVFSLSLIWLVVNAIRIGLVGSCFYFAFRAYVARLRVMDSGTS